MQLILFMGSEGFANAADPPLWCLKDAILDDVGITLAHFGLSLVHVDVILPILASFGVPNWSQTSVLRHLVGPLAPPRGPKEPLGSPRVPFWSICGSFWGHFWSQNRTKIDARNQCFFEHEFCQILGCFGVPFCDICWSFSGVAGIDHEKTPYVKFVDSIEKLTDFLEK